MNAEVAIYKGDEIVFTGTVRKAAAHLGVKPGTIQFYLTPSYKRRVADRKSADHSTVVVRI